MVPKPYGRREDKADQSNKRGDIPKRYVPLFAGQRAIGCSPGAVQRFLSESIKASCLLMFRRAAGMEETRKR